MHDTFSAALEKGCEGEKKNIYQFLSPTHKGYMSSNQRSIQL